MKACNSCGEVKALEDFHKLTKAKDGHQSTCKVCACRRARQHRLNDVERARANARLYYREHKEKQRLANKAWALTNKEHAWY